MELLPKEQEGKRNWDSKDLFVWCLGVTPAMARIEHVFLMRCVAEMKICSFFSNVESWFLTTFLKQEKMEGTPSSKLRMKFTGKFPKVSCLVKEVTCDQLIVTFSYNKRQLGHGDLGFCLKVFFFFLLY